MMSDISLSPIKRNSNTKNTFNNDEISPLLVFIIFESIFHNGKKRKPLNCIFYCGRPVQVTIMTINFFSSEGLDMLASMFLS